MSEQGDATEESGEAGRSVEVEDGAIAEPTPEKLLEIRDLQQQNPSLARMCCCPMKSKSPRDLCWRVGTMKLSKGYSIMSHRRCLDVFVWLFWKL